MSELRRVGGDMVPYRKPAGRRVLLQYEVDLCNAVGISKEEYWYFVDQAEAYNGKRSAEYEHIPDIQMSGIDPVTLIAIQLVIGIALTAISVLLAPKPKAQDQKQLALKTDDSTGRSRFTPQTSFGSLQELATIGSTIPLVFSRQGVRVNSTLLWSQLLSRKAYQELRAIMLFSHGRLETEPDFEGFAIGDTLLKDYPNGKFALYFADGFKNNNRIKETAPFRYPNGTMDNHNIAPDGDVFSIKWHEKVGKPEWEKYFSGARTPSSQTEFGVYSPFPNGMRYKINYELVLVQRSLSKEPKEAALDKKAKVGANFPVYAALISRNNNNRTFKYQIAGNNVDDDAYGTWGTEDVRQSIDRRRIDIDEALSVGEQYTIGACLAKCTSGPDRLWEPKTNKTYEFKVSEYFDGDSLDAAMRTVETEGIADTNYPYEKPTLLRASVGAVTNNRACDATEIGLKSIVWRKINGFPNVNTEPSSKTIEKFEKESGNISLGGMSKYVTRLSFFILQARLIGEDKWVSISDDKVFCVRGQSPREQYNYIRVSPPGRDQYEYRFVPAGGNYVLKYYTRILLMDGTSTDQFSHKGYRVFYSGKKLTLSNVYTENPEWFRGKPPEVKPGQVTDISPTSYHTPPSEYRWVAKETRYDTSKYLYTERLDDNGKVNNVEKIWDGNLVKDSKTTRYVKGDKQRNGRNSIYYEITEEKWERAVLPPTKRGNLSPTGGSGSGLSLNYSYWQVSGGRDAAIWSVRDGGQGYKVGDQLKFQIPGYFVRFTIKVDGIEQQFEDGRNLNPRNAIADYYMYDAEEGSHFNGPEHSIAYVNELQKTETPATYSNLAVAGIRLASGKEWASFGELSAYIKKGIQIDRLNPDAVNSGYITGNSASDCFPEIAHALLTDSNFGAGDIVGKDQVDTWEMAKAAQFCKANGFFLNGVISEPQNLREFIFQNAAYNLLDFTIRGGRFSLAPSVPYKTNYKIDFNQKVKAKALFTDGNIRKMQVSFLTPEERQMFRATVLYRQDVENGFPEVRSVAVTALTDANGKEIRQEKLNKLPEETFDLSGFCASRNHSIRFAKYALLVRKHVSHGIKFETTPQAAMGLEPGEYFRVVSEATHTSRFNTGSIAPDGTVFARSALANGNYSVFHWEPGKTTVQESTMTVKNGKATQAKFFGTVFSIKNTTTTNRMYKVETLSYAEDGLVELSGSEVPLDNQGRLRILEWDNADFSIRG